MSTYKTWVKGAHLLIDEGTHAVTPGLIPKISPLAVVTIALAQSKLDRMAKHVPVDAPWTAKRAAEWDSRSVAWWLERSGIRTTIARDLFEMAVRGLFTGDLNDMSFLHLLFLVRAHGSINTLFSIEGGSQENMVEGGAGSIARTGCRRLGRRGASERTRPVDHATRGSRRRRRGRSRGVGSPRRRHRPARARPRDRVRPRAPRRPSDAVPQCRRRSGDEDARGLRRAVLASRRLQRPNLRARLGRRGDPRRVTGVGNARRHRVVHVRTGCRARRRARRRRAAARGARRAHGQARPRAASPSEFIETAWWKEEWTRGCSMAHLPRGSSRATDRCSAKPFGRVHWAGTETSTTSHGAIDGAVRSGERAAAEILDRA